jgi:L-ribulose-5-phosphate 3-epimerase
MNAAAGAAPGASPKPVKFKVGVTDWNLKLAGNPEAVLWAAELLFDCLQVSIGRKPVDGKLALGSRDLQKQFKDEAKKHKLPLGSLCLDILHENGLKHRDDPLGPRWVADAIPIAKAMGVKVILLPFFGKHKLETPAEMDYVADVLKEIAPAASKAGVILGLEDTISARDNVRIMERTKSPAVKVYYDVGNSNRNGFDVVEEIKWLGRDRICEVHFKDNPGYLGKGPIDFRAVIAALADIGFDKYAQLETDAPSGDVEMDMLQNLRFVRELIRERNGPPAKPQGQRSAR